MSDYSSKSVKDAVRRLKIRSEDYRDVKKVGGAKLYFAILADLDPEWLDVWRFVAIKHPGLLERSPSPDHVLRRGREITEDMEPGQVQPGLV